MLLDCGGAALLQREARDAVAPTAADPRWAGRHWPLPTIASTIHPALAVMVDAALIVLFGLQHSLMARPWFKSRILQSMPEAFQRCTYVHAANIALLALILFWQPIPVVVWKAPTPLREFLSVVFVAGWIILFLGALSFGIPNLLGVRQGQVWAQVATRAAEDFAAVPVAAASDVCCSPCGRHRT